MSGPTRRTGAGPDLPDAFARRYRELLGAAEADRFLDALASPPARGLRLHPGRTDLASLARATGWRLDPLPWSPVAAVLDAGRDAPGRHPLHEAGAYYLQDPAATLPAAALAVAPGERVLDLAAAPGGKATQLACDLRGEGLLVANDVGAARLPALARNLERFGARAALITQASPAELARRWAGRFDAVLLDAPCSGEGMFRKSEAAVRDWSLASVAACAARQADLLDAAADLLAPGGRLAYATCTFAPDENEAVVADLLARRPDLEPVPLRLPGTAPVHPEWARAEDRLPADAGARAWPHLHPGDGHVVLLLRKRPDASVPPSGAPDGRWTGSRRRAGRPTRRRGNDGGAVPADRAQRDAWSRFRDATLAPGALPQADREGALVAYGGLLWAAPDAPDASGLRVLRPGLALGRTHPDGRFEPAHALAQALEPHEARRRLELAPTGPTAEAWSTGAELSASLAGLSDARLEGDGDEGATLVTVGGAPLGWARLTGPRLRNLLPKGLRRPG